MVKHIVFMKFPDKTVLENVKAKLLSMKGNIKELKDIEVGINFSPEERAYHIALTTLFESKEALENYAVHPYHQDIIKYLKSLGVESKVVDYEVENG
ncbi:Dabb family protein [Nitrosophilus alvini]|uniref:Dabb family protein n=1 Tax=Nitrosophilus alvini TaxID=2714855 RepID=UPI00190DBC45|nr:Dabb family protein [Nitrosophilus alvini]